MSGKGNRAKGQAGEREAAGRLTELLGRVVKRELGQERDGGCDIEVESTAGCIAIQVKRVERASMHAWLTQAENDAGAGELPAVMWRPSRRGWVVCMDLNDWCTLVREAQDA